MRTSLAPRLLGAGVLAAGLVAAAGGLTAAGALGALDPGAGSAAIVTHQPGTRTVTLEPGNTDLKRAAYSAAYDEQICSNDWLSGYTRCATQLQACAKQYADSTVPVAAVFYETGTLGSCKPLA